MSKAMQDVKDLARMLHAEFVDERTRLTKELAEVERAMKGLTVVLGAPEQNGAAPKPKAGRRKHQRNWATIWPKLKGKPFTIAAAARLGHVSRATANQALRDHCKKGHLKPLGRGLYEVV